MKIAEIYISFAAIFVLASRWYLVMPYDKEIGCWETRLRLSAADWFLSGMVTLWHNNQLLSRSKANLYNAKIFVWASNWYLVMPPLAEPVWYWPDAILFFFFYLFFSSFFFFFFFLFFWTQIISYTCNTIGWKYTFHKMHIQNWNIYKYS